MKGKESKTKKKDSGLLENLRDTLAVNQEDEEKLLEQRAKELAEVRKDEDIDEDSLSVIQFDLAYERYGIESCWVREVYPLKELTPVPCTPDFILGITSIRGQIISIMDLKRFFDLPTKGLTDLNRVLVLRNDEMIFGILADSIYGVRSVREDDLLDRPAAGGKISNDYIMGVTEDQLIVLDGRKILSDQKILIYDEG